MIMIISTTGEKRSDSGRPYPTTADLNISKKQRRIKYLLIEL